MTGKWIRKSDRIVFLLLFLFQHESLAKISNQDNRNGLCAFCQRMTSKCGSDLSLIHSFFSTANDIFEEQQEVIANGGCCYERFSA